MIRIFARLTDEFAARKPLRCHRGEDRANEVREKAYSVQEKCPPDRLGDRKDAAAIGVAAITSDADYDAWISATTAAQFVAT